jgi:hypothetical protein
MRGARPARKAIGEKPVGPQMTQMFTDDWEGLGSENKRVLFSNLCESAKFADKTPRTSLHEPIAGFSIQSGTASREATRRYGLRRHVSAFPARGGVSADVPSVNASVGRG